MVENRQISGEYSSIGQELIEKEKSLEYIKNSQATIIYLVSDNPKKSKGKDILAECERVPDKYKWCIPADFTITVFVPNVTMLTDEQKRILILHELFHVGITVNENGQEEYTTNPHDYEEFKEIIDRYGIDWSRPIKSSDDNLVNMELSDIQINI
jgi:hypothetical protein